MIAIYSRRTAIVTTYVPATDTKPAHIVARAEDGETAIRFWDHSDCLEANHAAAARKLWKRIGPLEGHLLGGSTKDGMAWVFVEYTNGR